MKILKKVAIGIIILILLIVVVSFFLPSKTHIEKSINIKAKSSVVFDFVNDLKKWKQWSRTFQIDTNANFLFTENSQGEGAWCKWESKNNQVGKAKITITQSKYFSFIECEMNAYEMGITTLTFHLDSTESGTKITWSRDSEGKGVAWYFYVVSKYASLFMEKYINETFEFGLTNLKNICEAIPQKETIAGFDVEEKKLTGINILSIIESVKNSEIGMKIGQNYELIGQYMVKEKIKETGSPLIILHKVDTETSDIEFAIPVDSTAKSNGKIIFSELPSTNAIVIKYFGDYGKTAPVYEAAKKYINSKRKKISGYFREVYITDPGTEKDTAKWLTEIIFPIE